MIHVKYKITLHVIYKSSDEISKESVKKNIGFQMFINQHRLLEKVRTKINV